MARLPRAPGGSFLWRFAVAAWLAGTCALPCVAGESASVDSVATRLEERIDGLRRAGDYGDAVHPAEELLAERRRAAARPDQVLDAERLLETVRAAAALPPEDRARLAEADRLRGTIEGLFKNAEYLEARDAVEREIELRDGLQETGSPDLIEAKAELGLVLLLLGDFDAAEARLTDALALSREHLGAMHPRTATILNSLAGVSWQRGDLRGAAERFSDLVRVRREILGDEHPDVAVSLNNLGLVLMESGEYAESAAVLRQSLAMKRKRFGDGSLEVAKGLNNLAAVLDRQGDRQAARDYYAEALQIVRDKLPPDHPWVATSLSNVGTRAATSEDAVAHLREALEVFRKTLGPDHPQVATTLLNLATVTHDPDEYRRLCREALAIQERTGRGDQAQTGKIAISLAQNLWDAGDCDESGELLRRALEIFRDSLGDAHPATARGASDLADWEWECGTGSAAESLFTLSVETSDRARRRAGLASAEPERMKWISYATTAGVRRRLAGHRLETGRGDDAWTAVEESLARATHDLLVGARGRFLAPEQAAREESLAVAVAGWDRRANALRRSGDESREEELGEAERELLDAEAVWTKFQLEMAREHPVPEGEAYPLARVQASIPPGGAIVGWLDLDESPDGRRGWGYVIRHQGPVRWASLPLPEGVGHRSLAECDSLRSRLEDPSRPIGELHGKLRTWWERRLAPLMNDLAAVDELFVVPSGGMLGVPLEALLDSEDRRVGDRFRVSYVPSATLYAWLAEGRDAPPVRPRKALLVGDPPFRAADPAGAMITAAAVGVHRGARSGGAPAVEALPRLAATRKEISAIQELFPETTVLLGPDASEARLADLAASGDLPRYDVVHLATHALVDDAHPEQSAVVLSQVGLPDPMQAVAAGTPTRDGLITAREIMRGWTLDADLVSLSACRTALGKRVGGEGYVGFTQAFLMAGARTLLLSLWDVDDVPTLLLMRRFYENWTGSYDDERAGRTGEPMRKAEALQEAKRWLSLYRATTGDPSPFEHPFYWSAFILVGSAD